MRILLVLLITAAMLAGQAVPAASQSSTPASPAQVAPADPSAQKAKELLDQMIQALGGKAWLDVQDMQQQGRTYSFYQGQPQGTGVLFWRFWKWPDKERLELTKQRDWTIIYNGDKGYETTFRGTAALDAEQLQDYLRRRHYSLEQVLRVWLKEPGVLMFYVGPSLAERKSAQQITIVNAKNEAVDIWIDDITHLPLRKSFVWREPDTRYRNEEAEGYDNYRRVQGVMTPFSITRYKNGETQNQRFINEVSFNQGLAESMFQATVGYDLMKK